MKMTSKLMTLSTLFAVALFFTASARAATVTYTLEYTPSAGTFDLYAELSTGDNFGLVTFGVPLISTDPNTVLLTILPRSPNGIMSDGYYLSELIGFGTLRSGPSNFQVAGGQNTVSDDFFGVGGVGQVDGSLNDLLPVDGCPYCGISQNK